jgi:penicillin-binding protein 2
VDLIRRALQGVTQEGTSTRSFLGAPYLSGGKTGTAQAVGIKANEKYNAAKLDEHKRDHSLYMAFAPLEAPTIALAVVVENAGFGSEAAAPMARRVFDYALLGQYPNAEDMAATREGKSGPQMGTPLQAADVQLAGATSLSASLGPAPVMAPASAVPAGAAASKPVMPHRRVAMSGKAKRDAAARDKERGQ